LIEIPCHFHQRLKSIFSAIASLLLFSLIQFVSLSIACFISVHEKTHHFPSATLHENECMNEQQHDIIQTRKIIPQKAPINLIYSLLFLACLLAVRQNANKQQQQQTTETQHTTKIFLIMMRLNLKYVLTSLILMVTCVTLMLWSHCGSLVRTFPKKFYGELGVLQLQLKL